MLGHQLLISLSIRHDVRVTLRRELSEYEKFGYFTESNTYDEIDVRSIRSLSSVLNEFKPDVVINAIGIVKQRSEPGITQLSIEVNALFPWQLAELCRVADARLVHLSTDCVFSGDRGLYTESDIPDAMDVYGRTKHLGELDAPHTITLRTSIIGLELHRKTSLIEWFLQAEGEINGYKGAIYSGFTTIEMSRIIENVMLNHPDMTGVWHVASEPISKYELLLKLAEYLGRSDITILPETTFKCDRSLDGKRFEKAANYHAPTWDEMLSTLADQIRDRN